MPILKTTKTTVEDLEFAEAALAAIAALRIELVPVESPKNPAIKVKPANVHVAVCKKIKANVATWKALRAKFAGDFLQCSEAEMLAQMDLQMLAFDDAPTVANAKIAVATIVKNAQTVDKETGFVGMELLLWLWSIASQLDSIPGEYCRLAVINGLASNKAEGGGCYPGIIGRLYVQFCAMFTDYFERVVSQNQFAQSLQSKSALTTGSLFGQKDNHTRLAAAVGKGQSQAEHASVDDGVAVGSADDGGTSNEAALALVMRQYGLNEQEAREAITAEAALCAQADRALGRPVKSVCCGHQDLAATAAEAAVVSQDDQCVQNYLDSASNPDGSGGGGSACRAQIEPMLAGLGLTAKEIQESITAEKALFAAK